MSHKPFVHIIHGIRVSKDDTSTPATLIPLLEENGYACFEHYYGYAWAITSRFLNQGRAEKIAPEISRGDFILAHSNGCDIARRLLEMTQPSAVILLQPALNKDTEFPSGDYRVRVFYNEDDRVTWLSMLFLQHPYGSMGTYGYKGRDRRVRNYNTLRLCGAGGHYRHIRENPCVRKEIIRVMDGLVAH